MAAHPLTRRPVASLWRAVALGAVLLVLGAACSDEDAGDTTTPGGLTEIGGAADVGATSPSSGGTAASGGPVGEGTGGSTTVGGSGSGTATATTRPGSTAGGASTTVAGASPGAATTSPTSSANAVTTSASSTTTPTTLAPTTTAPAVETLPPTTAAPASGPCDLATVVAQTETDFDGITPRDLRCAGTWAAWVGAADDPATSDSFFAVASWDGDSWVLANLGTASVCTDAGVPASQWPALGCTE